MLRFAGMGYLDRWYEHLTASRRASRLGDAADKIAARLDRFERKARSKTSLQALQKLAVEENGRYRIRSDPPVLFPLRDLPAEYDPATIEAAVHAAFDAYKDTLADDRRCLLDRYTPVDIGVKVVGVGSVGTRCFIILLRGPGPRRPAVPPGQGGRTSRCSRSTSSPSAYANQGRRVVEGQRLTQAQSDIFLGWTEGGIEGRHYYVRQLRDWKGSADIEGATPALLTFYAQLCGMTMARGHARSGDPIAIAAYMGKSATLDRAITDFAEAYAAQNRRDYRPVPCGDRRRPPRLRRPGHLRHQAGEARQARKVIQVAVP